MSLSTTLLLIREVEKGTHNKLYTSFKFHFHTRSLLMLLHSRVVVYVLYTTKLSHSLGISSLSLFPPYPDFYVYNAGVTL